MYYTHCHLYRYVVFPSKIFYIPEYIFTYVQYVQKGNAGAPQSTQSDDPVRFLIFCSISIFLLPSLVAGKGPQCSAGPP
jgi:hypothetical protein